MPSAALILHGGGAAAAVAPSGGLPWSFPTHLQIEPVGQCNLRCQMCAIQFRQDGPPYGPLAFMAFDKFTDLIDAWTGLGICTCKGWASR